jgi:hypothetical protein
MFAREPNNYDVFTNTSNETFNQDVWEKHLEKLKKIIRPAINQKVNIAHLIREDQFNAKFKLVVFKPKDRVMAKDVTRASKWHSFYEGPFEVICRNLGGAYILKDSANSILPFRFPPSHLKLVLSSTPLIEKSYPIKKILSHLPIKYRPYDFDYYVQFDIPDTTPVWIAAELFDSPIPVEKYWKSISHNKLKATPNNFRLTRDDKVAGIDDEIAKTIDGKKIDEVKEDVGGLADRNVEKPSQSVADAE